MYRKFTYSIFIISICCNIYCGFDYYDRLQGKFYLEAFVENSKIKEISLTQGERFLFQKIKEIHPEYEKQKKYYFISFWNTMCSPCIKEMPLLDSLADNINRNDFGYMFVTENGEKMITKFREKHIIKSRNFNFINDADIYISSILKSHNLENRQYPIQLIIDYNGNVKYFQIGTIESANDSLIMNSIKNLKE